jgi:hypothetical protein
MGKQKKRGVVVHHQVQDREKKGLITEKKNIKRATGSHSGPPTMDFCVNTLFPLFSLFSIDNQTLVVLTQHHHPPPCTTTLSPPLCIKQITESVIQPSSSLVTSCLATWRVVLRSGEVSGDSGTYTCRLLPLLGGVTGAATGVWDLTI